jgi:hypothetical protein
MADSREGGSAGSRPDPGRGVGSSILTTLAALLLGTALGAQEGRPAPSAGEPAAASLLPDGADKGREGPPGPVRISRPSNPSNPLIPGVDPARRPAGSPLSAGWWLGSAGIALILAAFGSVCLAARKPWPRDTSGLIRVVGRVSLSPRHSIYLVRAGDRTLLVGTGAQGAPTLLAELGEDEGIDGQAARATVRSTSPLVDIRLGEEE